MSWLASDMTSTTTATLECAAQVRAAASSTAATGWLASASSKTPSKGAVSKGWNSCTNWCSDSSSSPRPMNTRPRSRVRPGAARRNIHTPARMRMGASEVRSNDSSCTMRVVPTLAPSMAASAGTSATTPPAAKPVIISPVAVLLCSAAVMPRPEAKARNRVPSARPSAMLSAAPKARCTPVCTMCTPHSSRAT